MSGRRCRALPGPGRLANVLGPLIVSFLFASYGYGSVFACIAGCWLLVAFAIGIFGPRTSLRSLEQISASEAPLMRLRNTPRPSVAGGTD